MQMIIHKICQMSKCKVFHGDLLVSMSLKPNADLTRCEFQHFNFYTITTKKKKLNDL